MRGLPWRLVLADMMRLGYVQLNTRITGVTDSTNPRVLSRQYLTQMICPISPAAWYTGEIFVAREPTSPRDEERANPSRAAFAPRASRWLTD